MHEDDRDLYETFVALRREEQARVPPVARLSQSSFTQPRRRLSGKLLAYTMCLASLIAVAVWLLPAAHVALERSNHRQEQAVASITASISTSISSWKPGTDFLLETPGRALLEDVPAIGEWHGVAIIPGNGTSHRPLRKRTLP